jgi:hypothetical protein
MCRADGSNPVVGSSRKISSGSPISARQPVQPDRIAHDLPLHLMRFVLMETVAPREDVLAFLASLIDGLEQFVKGMEAYADAAGRQLPGRHPLLALRHGIVMHQASLDWARATAAELAAELPASPGDDLSVMTA